MADEFQNRICNGNWWNSARNGLTEASLPCSTTTSDKGSFGWPNEMVEMKARSCEDSVSVSGSSMVLQDASKSQGSDSVSGGSGGAGGVLMESNYQTMGYGLSSPTFDWNLSLLSSGRAESNFHSMLHQEDSNSRPTYDQETMAESTHIQKDWSPKKFSASSGDSSLNTFNQINQGLSLDQNRRNISSSSDAGYVTGQGLPTSFSMDASVTHGYPSLLQGLLEPDFQSQQPLYYNKIMNYHSHGNYGINTDEVSASWQKFPQFLKISPKQQQSNQSHFSNGPLFWNASATSVSSGRSSYFPPSQSQFILPPTYEAKPNSSNFMKPKAEELRDSGSVVKKGNNEPATKRPRLESASPLPTFKVRKEKLGDRITALQQLVSPFGKTDTASVLFEAIEYIRFLHDQVSVLSAPYMKNGAPIQQQQNSDKLKDAEGPQQDLRTRGLCLVPISSTYPVTNETAADFWTPTFGGTYR